jgi:hypothetical protein
MTDTRQSAQEAPARGPQQEDETIPTPTDQSETSNEQGDDSSEDTARRRATLNKEIRAGWRRALGH